MSHFVSQNVTTTNQALNKFFTFPIHLEAKIYGERLQSYLTKSNKIKFCIAFLAFTCIMYTIVHFINNASV